ncbi:MAG: GNAT family N-acetyltransferase [Actinobacteria bacterium]|nr:GNAT family N-acetyltransferase [Actinomycetota bacterium]
MARKELLVERLSGELIPEAADVLTEAFKTEETTAYHLDTDRYSVIRGMKALDRIFLQMYMEAARPILAALEEGHVVGVGILRDPRRRVSKSNALLLFLPELHRLGAMYLRHPIRTLRIMAASRPPRGLREQFITFEALGVHPAHQGKGVGKALMMYAQKLAQGDPSVTGIYLNTGSEKNRSFYESLGYETLSVRDLGRVVVYHMFWSNPLARQTTSAAMTT